jgi:hypothetical protein
MTEEQKRKQKLEADKRELQWTKARVEYNNSWPANGVWFSDIQKAFERYLNENNFTQIFEVVKLNDTAKDVLFKQAKLNKLVSGIVDIYDELPYRPDEGFDIAWRSLEIFMNHQRNIAWKNDCDKIPHLIKRTVNDMVMPTVKGDRRVKDLWEDYLKSVPLSMLVYTILRCYIEHDLAINTQIDKVSERAEDCLTKALYDDIKAKYKLEEKVKPEVGVLRKAALLLQLILKGEEVEVNGSKYQLAMEKRLEFMLSCVLYTYRCERFHGDYFSPFKSDRANLDTYAFSYYLLSFCYIYLWILIHRHCETYNLGEICSLDSIMIAAKNMQDRMQPLIMEGKR